MKIKELVVQLMKLHPDMEVQLAKCKNDFDDVYGISFCEEGKAIILCDKETYMVFSEGSDEIKKV